MSGLKRKEVWLSNIIIDRLQILADKKSWSLKQYMESTLIRESNKVISPSFKSPTNNTKAK